MRKIFILLFVLILLGCSTTTVENQISAKLPEKYEELSVSFVDLPDRGGLLLYYDEYRKLEINILNMRYYEEQLEDIILGDHPLSSKEAE